MGMKQATGVLSHHTLQDEKVYSVPLPAGLAGQRSSQTAAESLLTLC